MYIHKEKGGISMTLTTSISKWGNGQGIRIPKNILEFLKWTESEKVEIITEGECIKIKKLLLQKKKKIFMNFLKTLMENMKKKKLIGENHRGKKYGKAGRYYKS